MGDAVVFIVAARQCRFGFAGIESIEKIQHALPM